MSQTKDAYDKLEIRCFQLGDIIAFKYCRSMNQRLCCPLLFNCWANRLNLNSYLIDNFSEVELDKCMPDWRIKIQKSKEKMHAGYFGGIA
jgi:hypothetical protein